MSPPDLIVCGSLTLDNVVAADGTMLPQSAGGNVVYAALGAALWGPPVGLVSRAGTDFPAAFLAMLHDRGLDLGGIARVDAPHGMNVAFAYRPDGSRVRAFPPELIARIPPEERERFVDYTTRGVVHRFGTWLRFAPDAADLPSAWAASARGAHLAAMPVQRHLVLAVKLRELHPSCHVQVDSPWYDERIPQRDFAKPLSYCIDLLLPSEADLMLWQPAMAPLDAAATLARAMQRPVLVKLGAAGCVMIAADGTQDCAVPAYPVDAVDPTGAGDSFCGGVLAGLLRHGDPREAAIAGAVSASFTVEAAGLAGSLRATRDEAERRYAWVSQRVKPLQ